MGIACEMTQIRPYFWWRLIATNLPDFLLMGGQLRDLNPSFQTADWGIAKPASNLPASLPFCSGQIFHFFMIQLGA